jgi:homoserine kinase type II
MGKEILNYFIGVIMNVYLLQYLNLLNDEEENIKVLGIYSSKNEAERAVDRLKGQPGFKDHSDIINPETDTKIQGFYIDEYKVNEDHWREGFFTT